MLTRLQVTWLSVGGPPQQSAFEVQRSPVSRQPEAEAQTVAPLPGSRQSLLQQPLPAAQGRPSTVQPPVPGAVTSWQVPGPPPVAEQIPEQQSAPLRQMSPVALQLDARAQIPPWQLVEQQGPPEPQALPRVMQPPSTGFSGWQRPAAQLRLQQSEACAQVAPVVTQAAAHWPETQEFEQQSVAF